MTETAAAAVEIAPANTSSSNCSSSSSVQQVAPPRLDTISFAVSLPAAVWSSWDEPETTRSLPGDERGIVGTIVFMKKSVMIWFGWGQLVPEVAGTTTTTTTDDTAGATDDAIPTSSMTTRAVGRATDLSMGPLIVAMPRTKYAGAFCDSAGDASTSKLIGTPEEDDEMIGRQMSSRLSQRSGLSVFVSCSFTGPPPAMAAQGVDPAGVGAIQHRAAAMAEREIGRLLQEAKQRESV